MSELHMKHAFMFYADSHKRGLMIPRFKYVQKKMFVHPKPVFRSREQVADYEIKKIHVMNKNAGYVKKRLPRICSEGAMRKESEGKWKQKLPPICEYMGSCSNRNEVKGKKSINAKLIRNKTINVYNGIYEMKHLTKAIVNTFLKEMLEKHNINNNNRDINT